MNPTQKQKKRLRFLHICLSPAWGGLEMAVPKWNHILNEHGHKNYNIVTPGTPLEQSLRSEGLISESWENETYFSPKFTWNLRSYIQDMRIDAVILQSLRDLWLVTPALWGQPQVKLVGFTQMLLGIKKTDTLHRMMYNRLNHLCVLTAFQQQALKTYLPVPAQKYEVVPNFVDTKAFSPRWRSSPFRKSLGYSDDHFLVGCIGRIDPQKGQMELIEGFAELKKSFLNAKLALIGDVTADEERLGYKEKCLNKARSLGVHKDVQWLGFRKDVAKIMPNLDLFVLPSYAETFGFVVIEAMASGVPILATQAGGVPEILGDGQYGWLCKPKNGRSIGDSLLKIAGDPEERGRVQIKARQHVEEKYDRHKVYARFMNKVF